MGNIIVVETPPDTEEQPVWPAQCSCGRVNLDAYRFPRPTDDGAIGFVWCGYCRTKHMVYPPAIALHRAHQKAIRAVIYKHLAAMSEDLRQFEMTTNVHIGTGSIDCIAHDLVECANNPNALSVSNLHQAIRKMTEL